MEELLNKTIYNNRDLLKLSPDYIPSNTLLRLQVRRNMVKDTHIYGTFTYSHGQRKTTKLSKDRVKLNKEIDKLRNGFHNINLRNEILLKKNTKNTLLNTLTEDTTPIIIPTRQINRLKPTEQVKCHDYSNSRINRNLRKDKTKVSNFKCAPKNHSIDVQNKQKQFDEISEDKIISTECQFYNNLDIFEGKSNLDEKKAPKQSAYDDLNITNNKQMTVDTQKADLQSVLIMLAINSKSNENEDVDQSNNEIPISNGNDFVLVSNSVQNEVKTDFLNITPLRIMITDRQRVVMKKYVKKWRNYVWKRKQYIAQQRQKAINNFFDKLEKKKTDPKNLTAESKSKFLARDYSTYQHRYKMQKHIIALQKAKLEEQNRMIDELKYNKIIEASKHSVDAMKEEVRRTYFELDRHLKPKIKMLTNELKIPEIEEPSIVLHCLKVPQFLQRMEKRAREREEKHAMIRERRKQMEEERIRLKQQAELAKLEMDKEEKLKRIKELREKRKKERIESIRKKQYADRMRSLTVMADLHYERSLMAKFCIRPLKLLMELKRDNLEKAKAHHEFQLKKNVFLHWMFYTEDKWMERNYKAENLYRTKVLRMVFSAFNKNHHEYVLKRQVAEDYYDLYVTQLVLRKLREGIAVIRNENEVKMQKAILYHNRNLQFRILTCWRTLPALNALKREQEARKARWREKVLQVVPDYMPPDD